MLTNDNMILVLFIISRYIMLNICQRWIINTKKVKDKEKRLKYEYKR